MSGEWIAMGADLWTAPEVIQLSAFCQHHVSACQTRMSARCAAIGSLFRIWSIVDVHCCDGILTGYRMHDIDDEVGMDGFCEAMIDVGWLEESPQGLIVPQFEKWFSRSAKRRRMNATYQAESRERRQQTVSNNADKVLTTEQNRTEQNNKKKTPLPPVVIPMELDTEEFRCAWAEWIQHRKEIGKPLKPTSSRSQLSDFVTMGVSRSINAIRYTIRKGWQGIREEEERSNNPSKPIDRVGQILGRTKHANP